MVYDKNRQASRTISNMTGMDVFIGAALGYRFFRLKGTDLHPWRLIYAPAWDTAVQTAVCHQHEQHQPPVADCECGLYAYHHLDQLTAPSRPTASDRLVHGIVAGSGTIEVHEAGFRAERMQLLHLYGEDAEIRAAAARYQVSYGLHPPLPKLAAPIPLRCLPEGSSRVPLRASASESSEELCRQINFGDAQAK